MTAYINPHLNVEGDLFQEADRLGYLLKNGLTNESYKQDFGEFLAGTIDFSNPIAKQWYTGKYTLQVLIKMLILAVFIGI